MIHACLKTSCSFAWAFRAPASGLAIVRTTSDVNLSASPLIDVEDDGWWRNSRDNCEVARFGSFGSLRRICRMSLRGKN